MGTKKSDQSSAATMSRIRSLLDEASRLLRNLEGSPATTPRVDPLIGQRFGALTVIALAKSLQKSYGTRRQVLCRCDCGREVEVLLDNLKHDRTRSCGCQKGRKIAHALPAPKTNLAAGRREQDDDDFWGEQKERPTPKLPAVKPKDRDRASKKAAVAVYDDRNPPLTLPDGRIILMSELHKERGLPAEWHDYERAKGHCRKLYRGEHTPGDFLEYIEICDQVSREKLRTDPEWIAERQVLLNKYKPSEDILDMEEFAEVNPPNNSSLPS